MHASHMAHHAHVRARVLLVTLLLLLLATLAAQHASAAPFVPVAQSAVGRAIAPGCEPFGALTALAANTTSLDAMPATAMLEVVANAVVPAERQLETPIQLLFNHIMHSAWWDALAPFNDTAQPILPAAAAVPRIPPAGRTNANINTVWLHTLLRVCEGLLPAAVPRVRAFMGRLQLDPNNTAPDSTTMPGLGNFVGRVWVQHAMQDGLNSNGSLHSSHNRHNFSDYTSFIPANDAYELRNVARWQPLLETNDLGYFFTQVHITPQIRKATGFSINPENLGQFTVAAPYPASNNVSEQTLQMLRQQTDEVLSVSANLTDRQKMQAEFYDDKVMSLAPLPFWLAVTNEWDVHTLLGATMALSCAYDAIIASWSEKLRHNAVRPVSLIRHFYQGKPVKAYAGPGAGTQDILGQEFNSYMRTMPHAEYPSGTSSICGAFGGFLKRFLGGPSITPEVHVGFRQGCSRREPGATPGQDVPIVMSDLDTLMRECGMSRLHAGVHFMPSIQAGWELGAALSKQCFAKHQALANRPLAGRATAPRNGSASSNATQQFG